MEQAAKHGAALLASLGLPRLVTPDFAPIDPAEVGIALDAVIAALDDLDAPGEELEDEGHDEPALGWCERVEQDHLADGIGDDEDTLGWTAAVRQLDLGPNTEDGEHTLGSPERHPFAFTMTAAHFEPADGQGVRRYPRDGSQAAWAQGARRDGEGEAEPGFDLPEGDDERCASGDVDGEPSLGWPENIAALLDPARQSEADADRELDPLDIGAPWTAEQRADRQQGRRIGTELQARAEAIRRRAHPTAIKPGGNLIPVPAHILNALFPHLSRSPL